MNATTTDVTPASLDEARDRSLIRSGRDALRAAVLDAASILVHKTRRSDASAVLTAATPLITWGLEAATARDLMLRKQAITRHHSNVLASGAANIHTPKQFLDGCRALHAFLASDEN
ncbi:hypothetical protein [Streptosporangium longisporum]|uniref:DUF222 domain-containing protein n=1 Tax=Streptosporangium longisporum TaxID=46187 RepID=A0ABP6LA68_9ACTN